MGGKGKGEKKWTGKDKTVVYAPLTPILDPLVVILPEHDYVTIANRSVVCNVRTEGFKTIGNISLLFCTLVIL